MQNGRKYKEGQNNIAKMVLGFTLVSREFHGVFHGVSDIEKFVSA